MCEGACYHVIMCLVACRQLVDMIVALVFSTFRLTTTHTDSTSRESDGSTIEQIERCAQTVVDTFALMTRVGRANELEAADDSHKRARRLATNSGDDLVVRPAHTIAVTDEPKIDDKSSVVLCIGSRAHTSVDESRDTYALVSCTMATIALSSSCSRPTAIDVAFARSRAARRSHRLTRANERAHTRVLTLRDASCQPPVSSPPLDVVVVAASSSRGLQTLRVVTSTAVAINWRGGDGRGARGQLVASGGGRRRTAPSRSNRRAGRMAIVE